MRSKKRHLRNSNLYLILDMDSLKSRNPIKIVKQAVKSGVDIIQLRDKSSCAKDIIEYGTRLKKVIGNKALFIINDRVDICQILDGDGVHLGQDDISLTEARAFLGKDKIIGVSCHSLKEAKEAEKKGADYIAIGPVFKSPTKPELKAESTPALRKITRKIKIPIVAIGGINRYRVGKVLKCGANIVAVASAILGKGDIGKATADLKSKIKMQKLK